MARARFGWGVFLLRNQRDLGHLPVTAASCWTIRPDIWQRYRPGCGLELGSLGSCARGPRHCAELERGKPSPQQVAWQDPEFGVIEHFVTDAFLDREWGGGAADPKVFNPTQSDPDRWVHAAKEAGAKYIVLMIQAHDRFCLWPTKQTEYSVKKQPMARMWDRHE